MFEDNELERENADWRIREQGMGAELIRQAELDELRERMEAFYTHVVMVDIMALKKALLLREKGCESGGAATLADAFFKMFQGQGLRHSERKRSTDR